MKRTFNERKIFFAYEKLSRVWRSSIHNWPFTIKQITRSANQNWKPKHATCTKRGKHFNRPIQKVNIIILSKLQSRANLKGSFVSQKKTNCPTKIFD